MAFLGMKGTGDFAQDERPESWREGILREYPNGVAPLTAILSKMKSERTTDYHFHWWTKELKEEFSDVTGIFTDVELSSAYTSSSPISTGSYLYLQMSEEEAGKYKGGLTVHFVEKSNPGGNKGYGKVTQVSKNGSNSYIAVRLIRDIAAGDANNIDFVRVIGTSNPQGGARPESQLNNPVKYDNLTQIFRDPLSMTRTALQTRLRTVESRKEARREALENHAVRMEKAFYDSIMTETIGDNGEPETTTRGIIPFIDSEAPENRESFVHDSGESSGTTFVSAGNKWLKDILEKIYRFGNTEKLGICGSGALQGLNDIAEATGTINLETRQVDYGLQVVEWVTPHGILYLMTSPLFTQDPTKRHSIMITEPDKLVFKYIQDTIFKGDIEYDNMESSDTGIDGAEEEFLTEAGLEMHFPKHFGYLEDVGVDIP